VLKWLPPSINKLRTAVGPDSELNSIACKPKELTLFISKQLRKVVDTIPTGAKKVTLLGYFYGPNSFANAEDISFYALGNYHGAMQVVFQAILPQLPQSLTTLTLPAWYNRSLDILPNSLCRLVLGGGFNTPLGILPSGLQALEFRSHSNFEQRIEALPSALESLIFYGTSEFDFPLDEVLPPSLKALRFGDDFHHRSKTCTGGIYSLTVKYSQPLRKLPAGLRELALGSNCPVQRCLLPPDLAVLVLPSPQHLPSGLDKISAEIMYRSG
jgi:hypothetical protein